MDNTDYYIIAGVLILAITVSLKNIADKVEALQSSGTCICQPVTEQGEK